MSLAATVAAPSMERLPRGHHGLSPQLVRESQRERLLAAAAGALAERGYAQVTTTDVARLAGVSTGTLYKHFDDIWACLLAAHEAAATGVSERIEAAGAAADGGPEQRAQAGIRGALDLLAAEPNLVPLLCAEPPGQASSLWAARKAFVDRLATMLGKARSGSGPARGEVRPGDSAHDARLVGAALALVAAKERSEGAERLSTLAPTLARLLLS